MSIPTYDRPSWTAARPVVAAPENGSSTVPPGGQPAAIARSGRSIGLSGLSASGLACDLVQCVPDSVSDHRPAQHCADTWIRHRHTIGGYRSYPALVG